MSYPIPLEALDDRLTILGTAGAGKTYLALGAEEILLRSERRVVHVDPLGVAWGLRLAADGKSPSAFNTVIFGGRHGDLPINEHAGALIGETVATMAESCILDLSELGTKAAERRFMLGFLKTAGLLDIPSPGRVSLTDSAPYDALSTEGARDKMLSVLTAPQRKIVDAVLGFEIATRAQIANETGYSEGSGGFNNLVGSLCTIGILEKPTPGAVAVSAWAREVLS